MAVVSHREVVGRSLSHQFGQTPTAERKFVVTLDSTDTGAQAIYDAIGIYHTDPHPEFSFLKMKNASVSEGSPSPYHAEVTYSYEVISAEDEDPNPLARPDVWSFGISGTSIPAYYYYADDGTKMSLVNSAQDFFEGATADEAEIRLTIQSNRALFPLALATSVTNCINNDLFLNSELFSWKCAGISAQQATEVVNNAELTYWQITSELVWRQSGWLMQLPDIGYNCIEDGEKIRAYVLDPDDKKKGIDTRIPCASPVALNNDGTIKDVGTPPNIIVRRVHKTASFIPLFGTGPASVFQQP